MAAMIMVVYNMSAKINIMYSITVIYLMLYLSGCANKPSDAKINSQESRKVGLEHFDNETKHLENNSTQSFKTQKRQIVKTSELLEEIDAEKALEYLIDEPGWIEVKLKKRFSDNINRLEAKSIMLSEMRSKAINKKVSQNLQITQLITDRTISLGNKVLNESNWSGFFKSTISGMITKEVERKNMINYFKEGQGFDLELVYTFYVIPVEGQPDPNFTIECKLNKQIFKNGGELIVNVNSSLDGYLYIFNMMADNNAALMFPNKYMTDNFISSQSTYVIPPTDINDYVSFSVGKMPGDNMTMEHIYILCTKKNFSAPINIPKIETEIELFNMNGNGFLELQEWLSEIPLDERVESILTYYVSD